LTERASRLYPLPPREISAESIYEDLELPPPGLGDAHGPYVIINMVSSIDGRVAKEGKAQSIGSGIDRRAMRTLRSKTDAVMIGANTLRAEKVSLGLDESEPESPQPLAVILTETGEVPLESNLVGYGRQEVLVVAPQRAAERLRGRAGVLAAPTTPSGAVDLGEVLRRLAADYGVSTLLVEGGPVLNHALISRGLADELFLTLAPRLLGGHPEQVPTILSGHPFAEEVCSSLRLLSVYLAGSELFLRYSLSPSGELPERHYHN
jgi:2,5-diamino-6-(ribosylamino)-4(3H)-pyrimidinone 5'-phosphate reductase